MRYVSAAKGLVLITKDGTHKYTFKNGVLDLGSGVAIVPDLAGADTSALQNPYPTAGSDLGKVGKDVLFWESPELLAATAIVVGNYYRVIRGTIVHSGVTYKAGGPGARFKATATAFTGTGVIGLDVPAIFYKEEDDNDRKEHFKINNLVHGDESTWDDSTFTGTAQSSTFTR